MEAKAITRHIRQSPRKIGVVLDEIRGLKFDEALNYLHFSKAKASAQIEKTLRSAYHNLINKIEDEKIKNVAINALNIVAIFIPLITIIIIFNLGS